MVLWRPQKLCLFCQHALRQAQWGLHMPVRRESAGGQLGNSATLDYSPLLQCLPLLLGHLDHLHEASSEARRRRWYGAWHEHPHAGLLRHSFPFVAITGLHRMRSNERCRLQLLLQLLEPSRHDWAAMHAYHPLHDRHWTQLDSTAGTSCNRCICQLPFVHEAVRLASAIWADSILCAAHWGDHLRHSLLRAASLDYLGHVWHPTSHSWWQQPRRLRAYGWQPRLLALGPHLHLVHAGIGHVWAGEFWWPPLVSSCIPVLLNGNVPVDADHAEHADRHHGRHLC